MEVRIARQRLAIARVWGAPPTDSDAFRGTAFLVASDRLLTAHHVVRDISPGDIYLTGRAWEGWRKVDRLDARPERDVALLHLAPEASADDIPSISIAEPKALALGTAVIAAGFSTWQSGLEVFHTVIRSYDDQHRLWLLDGYVPRGVSGGPALLDGKLIGVVHARHVDRNATFIVPLSGISDLLEHSAAVRQRDITACITRDQMPLLLAQYPVGPPLEPGIFSLDLAYAFARQFQGANAVAVVDEAIRLARIADGPGSRRRYMWRFDLPLSDKAVGFWLAALHEARTDGPRTLAAVLMIGVVELRDDDAVQECLRLLDRLRS